MKRSSLGIGAIPCVLILVGASSAATAQSLVRVSTRPGGVQSQSGTSWALDISQDGRFVLMSGADELVAGDDNQQLEPVIHDRWTGQNRTVLLGIGGAAPDNFTYHGDFSANGLSLVVVSDASNLVVGDSNGSNDVFLVDLSSGLVERASVGNGGAEAPFGGYFEGFGRHVSADGRFVVVTTDADNWGWANPGAYPNIYVRDTLLDVTEAISVTPSGALGDDGCGTAVISEDGRFVAFLSYSSDLVGGDNNQAYDVFLRDRSSASTTRLNLGPGAVEANSGSFDVVISGDARWVAFSSSATNLLPGAPVTGTSDIYLLDRQSGTLSFESGDHQGGMADNAAYLSSISHDGQKLLFVSDANDLDPLDSDGGETDTFVRDRTTQTTRLISRSTGGFEGVLPLGQLANGFYGVLSADGSMAIFTCNLEGLVAGDTNEAEDVFLWLANSTCPPIETYCTAKLNSLGCIPSISAAGEPRLSGTDAFFVTGHNLRSSKSGLACWSQTASALPFGGGILCLGTPIVRAAVASSGGNPAGDTCEGTYSFHFSQAYLSAHAIAAGTTLYAQHWSRDPGFPAPDNIGLSDALRFTVVP